MKLFCNPSLLDKVGLQEKKSRIRETLNLSTDADYRTSAKITLTRFRMESGGYNPEQI